MTPIDAMHAEPVLRVLIISIAALFVAALSLAAFVMWEHARSAAAEVRARALEARWSAALHDVLAGDAAVESLAALVDAHERWHFAEYLTEFATRLKGEELDLARQAARIAVRGIASVLTEGSPASRAKHVRTMALLGGPEHAQYVVAALGSPSSLVSATAARWLSRPEYSMYARDVIGRLSRFRTWSPRFLGVLLARFGQDAAAPLRELLEQPGHALDRVGAARALWWMKDVAAAESAARLLSERALEPDLAESCLRLVERCGVERHAAAVRPWCEHENARVRGAAFAALCVVGEPSDSALVSRGVSDPNAEVGLDAAFALVRARRADVEVLSRSGNARTAAIAREALAS